MGGTPIAAAQRTFALNASFSDELGQNAQLGFVRRRIRAPHRVRGVGLRHDGAGAEVVWVARAQVAAATNGRNAPNSELRAAREGGCGGGGGADGVSTVRTSARLLSAGCAAAAPTLHSEMSERKRDTRHSCDTRDLRRQLALLAERRALARGVYDEARKWRASDARAQTHAQSRSGCASTSRAPISR